MDNSSFENESFEDSVNETNTRSNASERLHILQMIEDGKVTAAQGASLLAAMDPSRREEQRPASMARSGPNWFRVRVTDLATGKSRASVSIPLGLMDWGLKIGAHFAPEVSDVNLSSLGEALRSGVEGKIIDVIDDEDGEHVEIFVE
jgi:hypothetical protein